MRKALFNLHLWTAMVAGVFILVSRLTGTVIAFEPELDRVMHRRLSYVVPQGHTLPLAAIGAAALKAYPGERIAGYLFPTAPDLAYQVGTKQGTVCVNPYTGEILGVLPPGPTLLSQIHQLHLRLLDPQQIGLRQDHHGHGRTGLALPAALRTLFVVAREANQHRRHALHAAFLVRRSNTWWCL